MDYLRNWLLKHNAIQLYDMIVNFLSAPDCFDSQKIINNAPTEIRNQLEFELKKVMLLYATNRPMYLEQYTYGQIIIWNEVIKAFRGLTKQKENIESICLSPDTRHYEFAVNEIKKLLYAYSKMQIILSDLEETLGVDRFLDRVSEETFRIFKEILDETKKIVETKAEKYKAIFQTKYNTTNVNKVIAHSLIHRNDENQVCDQFLSINQQVILLIIDGFGFCQYLWNRGIDSKQESFTFKENLFSWLSKNHLLKELILGSSFITDTGAGLAQIYLGQKSRETKIYASKIKSKGSSSSFIETKRIDSSQFNSLFSYNNSITDIVSTYWDSPIVYYCSQYQNPPSGFSNCIFKGADVKQVIPSERVFSMVLEDMLNGQIEGLQILYLTNIDNSSHTMGAYSEFEKQEHKRIDYLLRNYIIEMAINMPELFDGHRSILITADHGMYESSKIMISRQEITNHLNTCGVKNIRLVENNRAMLFYNEGHTNTEEIAQLLKDFFNFKKVKIDVQTQSDNSFSECLGSDNTTTILPDIIARFIGEGLFYSNPNANEHLLHFGGHGGYSIDEVFVPLLEIPLNKDLLDNINKRFLRIM